MHDDFTMMTLRKQLKVVYPLKNPSTAYYLQCPTFMYAQMLDFCNVQSKMNTGLKINTFC